jgi:Divergent InlB B-repeat domain
MKKVFGIFCVVVLGFSVLAFAALPVTLAVNNTNPDVNKVIATDASTGTVLFTCGGGSTTCSKPLHSGTTVRLTAQPASSFGFVGYTSNTGSATVCTNNPVCNFTIKADTKTTAKFQAGTNLTVAVGAGGTGTIKIKNATTGVTLVTCSDPAPIGCTAGILVDTKIRIEAIAGLNQQFANWNPKTGSATVCTGQGATFFCEFILKTKSSAVANFVPIP